MIKKKKLTICVFIDAFGWEILNSHSFLSDILVTRAPLGTVLGYSSTCVPTILTGKLPREHGHLSFFRFDPGHSPFHACSTLRFIPDFITRRGRVRRWLSKAIQKYYGYTGYFQIYNMPFQYLPLFDYTEKRDIYQTGGINEGTPTIFDLLRERKVAFHLSDWRKTEEENIQKLKDDLRQGQIEFAYLYLAAMDALLHAEGTGSPRVDWKIQWYDRNLRSILSVAEKNYSEVRLFLFSDHGMTNIKKDLNLIARVDELGLKFGVDYAAMYDSTMARFWFLKDQARSKVEKMLRNESDGHILTPEEVAYYGIDFSDNRYGELFFLTNPGVLICPSFMGETHIAGMHGFDPFDKDSTAMFASNVVPEVLPARLDELFQIMEREATE